MKINKKVFIASCLVAQSLLYAADDFQSAIANAKKLLASPGLQYITLGDICPGNVLTHLLERIERVSARNTALTADLRIIESHRHLLEAEVADALEKKIAILRLLGVQSPVETLTRSSHVDSETPVDTPRIKVVIRFGREIVEQISNSAFNQATAYFNNAEYEKAFELFKQLAGNEDESDTVRAKSCASLGAIYRRVDSTNPADQEKALACFQDALDFCKDSDTSLRQDIQKNIQELNELITVLEELPPLTPMPAQEVFQDDEQIATPAVSGRRKRNEPSSSRSLRKSSKAKRARGVQQKDRSSTFCNGCGHQFSTVSNYNQHIKRFPRHEIGTLLLPPPSISPAVTTPCDSETESE